MLNSKLRQIEGFQRDIAKILTDKADVNKKLADKRKRRIDAALKLQREEATQAKALER